MEQLIEFIGNHWLLSAVFMVILSLLLADIFADSFSGYQRIDPNEATVLLNHNQAVVIDVRESSELKDGVILNSVHIPMSQVASQMKRLDKYKSKPVIVSCQSGHRSKSVCKQLHQQGFESVYNLTGGIMAWRSANLPIEKAKS